jgi:hypothetical protein
MRTNGFGNRIGGGRQSSRSSKAYLNATSDEQSFLRRNPVLFSLKGTASWEQLRQVFRSCNMHGPHAGSETPSAEYDGSENLPKFIPMARSRLHAPAEAAAQHPREGDPIPQRHRLVRSLHPPGGRAGITVRVPRPVCGVAELEPKRPETIRPIELVKGSDRTAPVLVAVTVVTPTPINRRRTCPHGDSCGILLAHRSTIFSAASE